MVRIMESAKDFDEKISISKETPLWMKIIGGLIIGLIVFAITYGIMFLLL